MSTLQGLRQASARAIAGTALDYNGDMRAMFEAEATIPAGTTYNGAFLIWLNARLSASHADLPTAMAEFAAAQGVDGWDDVGEFDPAFLPSDIAGLEIWLDASDAATVTAADVAGTVRASAWASKAGAARSFAQGTDGNKPAYVSGQYLDFSAARVDRMTLSETTGLNWSTGTIFAIYRPNNTAAQKNMFSIGDSTVGRFQFATTSAERVITFIAATTSMSATIGVDGLVADTAAIGDWEVGVSGTSTNHLGQTATDSTYAGPTLTYDTLYVGCGANAVTPMDGRIRELAFWPGVRVDAGQKAQLFAYAATKWGVS